MQALYREKEMNFNSDYIGKRVETARKNARLTQDQLAELVGLERIQIYNIESNLRKIKPKELAKIIVATNTSIGFFRDPKDPVEIVKPQKRKTVYRKK
jgi:transcriptional regulator with XRE-family HTH domain